MLKKQKGNMYEFIDYVWSPIRGRCSHLCNYCYVKGPFYGKIATLPPLHIDEKDMKTDLGRGNFIFVCHTIDLFAEDVPTKWIERVIQHLRLNSQNKYLLQSKNPKRFLDFFGTYPADVLFGTTIETNRDIVESKAPPYIERAKALAEMHNKGYETMVTIEPIFDFDLDELVKLVVMAKPEWVNIGADSKGHKLPEPPKEKIKELIKALGKETAVKLKGNLSRLTRGI